MTPCLLLLTFPLHTLTGLLIVAVVCTELLRTLQYGI
jgi:uncharacterized membrane protein YfcA